MAEYLSVAAARERRGLRLVLTRGVPGPWGETAKAILEVKGIPYLRVAQEAGGENTELVAWTGAANAPTAVYDDEAPVATREGILLLAERLAPEPPLLPADPLERATVRGLCEEIGGADGFGWNRRLMMLAPLHAAGELPESAAGMRRRLSARYGYSDAAAARAPRRVAEITALLAGRLHAQRAAGSPYLVGERISAADCSWAAFAAMLRPLPEADCAMPAPMRASYALSEPFDPILLEHRDFVYREHLTLPLDL